MKFGKFFFHKHLQKNTKGPVHYTLWWRLFRLAFCLWLTVNKMKSSDDHSHRTHKSRTLQLYCAFPRLNNSFIWSRAGEKTAKIEARRPKKSKCFSVFTWSTFIGSWLVYQLTRILTGQSILKATNQTGPKQCRPKKRCNLTQSFFFDFGYKIYLIVAGLRGKWAFNTEKIYCIMD